MNPMTNVKNITKLCEEELRGRNKTSWHEQYRGSAWIFVGGLPYDLTEGDIICVFSQYGEPINVNLVRDKDTGKSKGFCFICYEDQRSTDLAVDNLNGIKLLGRTLRVDHVEKYKPPKNVKDEITETTSKVKKEKRQKDRENLEDDSQIFEQLDETDNQLSKSSKKGTEKHNHESYHDSDERDAHSRKKKELKIKKKRKRRDSDPEIKMEGKSERRKKKSKRKSSSSSSSLSSSTASLSALSSSTTSSTESKKNRKLKTDRDEVEKRNKTIRDLRREAKLIQAELKRRQQADERTKKSHRDINGKQHSKKESRRKDSKSGSSREHWDDSVEKSENRRREKK